MKSPNSINSAEQESKSERPRIVKAIGKLALQLFNKSKQSQSDEEQLQYNRMIKFLSACEINYLDDQDVKLFRNERQMVINDIRSGLIDLDSTCDWLFDHTRNPMETNPNQVYETIIKNRNKSSIYFAAIDSKEDPTHYTNEHSFYKFERFFPYPDEFEQFSKDFLESIKTAKNPFLRLQYKQYKKDMQEFKHDVYGKQQTYWEEIKKLKREAFLSSKEN